MFCSQSEQIRDVFYFTVVINSVREVTEFYFHSTLGYNQSSRNVIVTMLEQKLCSYLSGILKSVSLSSYIFLCINKVLIRAILKFRA